MSTNGRIGNFHARVNSALVVPRRVPRTVFYVGHIHKFACADPQIRFCKLPQHDFVLSREVPRIFGDRTALVIVEGSFAQNRTFTKALKGVVDFPEHGAKLPSFYFSAYKSFIRARQVNAVKKVYDLVQSEV